ncbi:MAG: hypothetical protein R2726_02075 [Acidimicrobiales bacterium]
MIRPVVASVVSALPPAVDQREVAAVAPRLHPELAGSRYLDMFTNAGIESRHLALGLEEYLVPRSLGERAALAEVLGGELAADAAEHAMAASGIDPADIETLVYVSSTVLRAPEPGVDLIERLGLPTTVRRVPIAGMASLGGAAGIGLAADLVRAGLGPAVVVACEMNSLTFVAGDPSPESVVTMALFSDGAAAVVVAPDDALPASPARLEVVGYHSTLVPDSLDVMGFAMTDDGLLWHLSPDVPDVARRTARGAMEAAVASVGWTLADLQHVLLHPGGAKVLDAAIDALALPADALRWSRRRLAAHGNLSSVTLLTVLQDFLGDEPPPAPGRGIATAMGPGFGYESVLVELRR